jgi:hypothetical protein|tara:strand:- start:86 stop:1093 length:1008 start_codon:yes stop_codon:yes gene_type:complete
MTKKNKTKFYKNSHKPVTKYRLLAKPLSKAPEIEEVGIYKIAQIKKENIGVDEAFQRALNKNQIRNIQENWDDDDCDLPNIYLHKYKGKYYPQITDGQHRICASPHDTIDCRVVNTLASITRCMRANDPKTKSQWEVNARFWGHAEAITRLNESDPDNLHGIIKLFKQLGYNPLNPTKEKALDLGSNVAALHGQILAAINSMLRNRLLSSTEKAAITKKVMEDTVKIVDHVFRDEIANQKAFGMQMWSGLPQFLLDSVKDRGLGGDYDIENIKNIIANGIWSIGGSHPRKEPLKTFVQFEFAVLKYQAKSIKGVSGRKANCWQRLFFDMHKLYNK